MGGAEQSISLNAVPSLIFEVALYISHADVGAVEWQEASVRAHGYPPRRHRKGVNSPILSKKCIVLFQLTLVK